MIIHLYVYCIVCRNDYTLKNCNLRWFRKEMNIIGWVYNKMLSYARIALGRLDLTCKKVCLYQAEKDRKNCNSFIPEKKDI